MANGDLKEVFDWLGMIADGLEGECKEVAIEVIDDRTRKYVEVLIDNLPVSDGDLKESLVVENKQENRKFKGLTGKFGGGGRGKKAEEYSWYGYQVLFDGYREENGKRKPLQKIANSLNYGTEKRLTEDMQFRGAITTPLLFMEQARRELRGMDKEIYDNTQAMLNERGRRSPKQ